MSWRKRHALEPRPYVVVVAGSRRRTWSRFRTRQQALEAIRALRAHGFDARLADDVEVKTQPAVGASK